MSFGDSWRNLNLSCLPSSARAILFLLVHNKLPVAERLFRIKVRHDPYCDHCLGIQGAVVADMKHLFCDCEQVLTTWKHVRSVIDDLLPGLFNKFLDEELIQLNFSKTKADKEIVWIVGQYVQQAWDNILEERGKLSRDKVFDRQEQDQFGLNIPGLT